MTRPHHILGAVVLLLSSRHAASQENYVIVPGDVIFASMFTVNSLHDGTCGPYDGETLQSIVAITWFVEALNTMGYIPGLTIGLDVYRTCYMPTRATEGAVKLLNKYGFFDDCTTNSNATLFGLLGPGRTSEAMAVSTLLSSLPSSQRLLQISGSATGKQLSDSSRFPNFFRVVPPDDTQVRVILELLLQLQWNYVAIVYDDDEYGTSAAMELRQLAEERQLCIPVFASLPIDTKLAAFAIKATEIANELKSAENGLVRGVVILGGASTTNNLLETLGQHVSYVTLVLSEAVALQRTTLLTPSGKVSDLARGAMVTSPPYLDIPEVTALWNRMWSNQSVFERYANSNPWLAEYFYQIAGCSHRAPLCWDQAASLRIEQMAVEGRQLNLYISYQVKAAAAMAALLKQLHDSTCGSSPHDGVCPALQQKLMQRQSLLDTLRHTKLDLSVFSSLSSVFSSMTSVAFNHSTANMVNAESAEVYTVFNFRENERGDFSFVQIGSWLDGTLMVNTSRAQFYDESQAALTWSQLPPAQCAANQDCTKCEVDVSHDVIFVEGDFYVIGLAPVSDLDKEDVLQCGAVKSLVGADLAQSMVFAVQQVNQRMGIFRDVLPGRKLGLLVINSCGSAPLVRKRLMDLHAGAIALPGNRNSSSLLPHVMGYVAAYFSGTSIAAAETLNSLGRPFVQISAASTSPALSDTERFPYFLRLSAPDNKQTQALLDIVQSLGANYIQVIYDGSSTYAKDLFFELQDTTQHTDRYNICIAQSIVITPLPDVSQYFWVKDKLRQKYAARVVIVILHHTEIEEVMSAILPNLNQEEFLFLASESWGRRPDLITGQHRIKLEGSLVLSQEIVIDRFFQQYFQALHPQNSLNPWLAYFWESKLNCYFTKSFRRKGKTGPCPQHFAQDYLQDVRIPFFINTVYALTLGFHEALTKVCGSQSTRVCQALKSSDLLEEMLKVKLDLYSTGQADKVFDSKGDGLVGYKVLQIQHDDSSASPDAVTYSDKGYWTLNKLTLDVDTLSLAGKPTFRSVCPDHNECTVCFPPQPTANNSNVVGKCQNDQGSVAAFTGVVVVLILIIAVLVGVVLFILCRQRNAQKARAKAAAQAHFNEVMFRPASDCVGNSAPEPPYSSIDADSTPSSVSPPARCRASSASLGYIHAIPSAHDLDGDTV